MPPQRRRVTRNPRNPRNRIVELQEPITAHDPIYNAGAITWVAKAEVWASFQQLGKNTERHIREANKDAIIRMGQFGIVRPDVDFDERWRIVEVDGLARTWNVVGIARNSRHADWLITVKA